jgi:hypothetical protein
MLLGGEETVMLSSSLHAALERNDQAAPIRDTGTRNTKFKTVPEGNGGPVLPHKGGLNLESSPRPIEEFGTCNEAFNIAKVAAPKAQHWF